MTTLRSYALALSLNMYLKRLHKRLPLMTARGVILMGFCVSACSDAGLYHSSRAPVLADRVTLTGEACTEDERGSGFPVRLVVMVDQAPGELYSAFDPGLARLRALNELMQQALTRPEVEVALIGYGGRAARLAPLEGSFTRDPSALLSAVNQLALPARCFGEDTCRDPLSALSLASGVIQDDLATMDAGLRALTRYELLWVVAEPAEPLARGAECCAPADRACLRAPRSAEPSEACQLERELEGLKSLEAEALDQGAGGVSLSVLHLRASSDEARNEQARLALERLTVAGRGRYSAAAAAELIDTRPLGLFEPRGAWESAQVVAVNLSAAPRVGGLEPDSDLDGLSDEEERRQGTDPLSRDTDGDGVHDGVEAKLGLSPDVLDVPEVCASLSEALWRLDRDLDGLNECEERLVGSDPSLTDSDGDDLPDGLELSRGTDHLNADSALDFDEDGVPNGDEVREGSDPQSVDEAHRLGLAARYEVSQLGAREVLSLSVLSRLEGARALGASEGLSPGVGLVRWYPREGGALEELVMIEPERTPDGLNTLTTLGDELIGALSFKGTGEGELGPLVPVWREGGERPLKVRLYSAQALEGAPELLAELWSRGVSTDELGDEERARREGLPWVELEVRGASLPRVALSEELVARSRVERCLSYTVRNVRLVGVEPTVEEREAGERVGLNELRLYVSQKRMGRSELPGRLLVARVPVRYEPPARRTPSGASLLIEQSELVGPSLSGLSAVEEPPLSSELQE